VRLRKGTVFISWSGERSRAVAEGLYDALSNAMPHIPFRLSSQDVRAGRLWMEELSGLLEGSDFGVLCLTPENRRAPWVLFEAGAISKGVGRSCVVPYVLDFPIQALEFPLAAFQAVPANKDGTHELIKSLNQAFALAVPADRLERIFETHWPGLKERLGAARSVEPPGPLPVEVIPFDTDPVMRHALSNGRLDACAAGELVRFIAITARNTFDRRLRPGETNRVLDAVKRGVEFRGVVLDPCSPQADERALVESPGEPRGSRLLEMDAAALKEWLNGGYRHHGIPADKIRNLEIRYSRSVFSFGMFLYSDGAFIEPFHLGKIDKYEHLCGFSILRCPRGTHDFEVVEKHFQYLFENGTPIA